MATLEAKCGTSRKYSAAKDRVVNDVLETMLLGEIVGDQTLGEFVRRDGVEQVELVHAIECLLHRRGVEQVAFGYLHGVFVRVHHGTLIAGEHPHVRAALTQFLNHGRADQAGPANYECFHRRICSAFVCCCFSETQRRHRR
jgi:hypothetical protein